MEHLEAWFAVYLLNALWQIPLFYFTGWIVFRQLARAEPSIQHRVWVATLLAQVVLPATYISFVGLLRTLDIGTKVGSTGVTTQQGVTLIAKTHGLHVPAPTLHVILLTYACTLTLLSLRLLLTFLRTQSIRRSARPAYLSDAAREASFYRNTALPAEVATSHLVNGPVTLGLVRPLILFPPRLLEDLSEADLEAVLAHEFAHIRRADFLKNLLYRLISLPVAFHPCLHFTMARIAETREIVCDQEAAGTVLGARTYAHSLLSLATLLSCQPPANIHHALGLAEANIFERRIMKLTQPQVRTSAARRILLTTAATFIAVVTCASASALRLKVDPAALVQNTVKVPAGDMVAAEKKMPVYPAEAKANHDTVDGPVILAVVIGKDGFVKEIHVQQSLRTDYDLSALDAVRNWRWTPYMVNGEPADVETTVTVNYSRGI